MITSAATVVKDNNDTHSVLRVMMDKWHKRKIITTVTIPTNCNNEAGPEPNPILFGAEKKRLLSFPGVWPFQIFAIYPQGYAKHLSSFRMHNGGGDR